jgi:hypothetical protein
MPPRVILPGTLSVLAKGHHLEPMSSDSPSSSSKGDHSALDSIAYGLGPIPMDTGERRDGDEEINGDTFGMLICLHRFKRALSR